MIGVFRPRPSDPHVARRRAVLQGGLPLPEATGAPITPDALAGRPSAPPGRDGLLRADLAEPLSTERFLAFGDGLGKPLPESDPFVLPWVEHGVVLNLVDEYAHPEDPARQPFSAAALTLHSERSDRAVAAQPRYVVLMCCAADPAERLAQTVLVPMASVHDALTPDERRVLAATRCRSDHDVPPILRYVQGRPVFAFRDLGDAPFRWVCPDGAASPAEVDGALRALLAAMYQPRNATGIRWRRGTLAVIDNTFSFHGRSAAGAARRPRRRHLKRLRIRHP
ncbi:TauD/TfdA family dioxygenase [Actinocorallia sp. API 0066]|uniref:TauD/TfdA family dioxygenase n=1 Tax=Actinocorallia sp. API 0066 TaxID=2896846 RepID=UPI001E5BB872|nr:TauD/TfdA family dioxygenase [Actinocorallia sp. API 0066]MCD0451618.1 TauD/TfdA family dioxygenase [Actinocorallia sp. API 0066]